MTGNPAVQKRLFILAVMGLLFLVGWQVFSTIPFLQHELIGQVYWWGHSEGGFWGLLFDSTRMDCHAGRFRYVDWLLQAGYWKAMIAGWLPWDLYDYFALFIHVVCGVLIYKIAKKRELSLLAIFLLMAFYFLSAQTFLTVLFHFRKAKYLVSFYLLLLAFLSLEKEDRWPISVLTGVIAVLGVITDPYFILFTPIFSLGLGISQGDKNFLMLKRVCLGLFLGFCLVGLLNGVIGPTLSTGSGIFIRNIPGVPPNFLKLSNTSDFFKVLPEIVFPTLQKQFFGAQVFLTFMILVFVTVAMIRCRFRGAAILLTFTALLPIAAFFIKPDSTKLFFSGYYGHPLIVVALLCLVEIFAFLKRKKWIQWQRLAFALVALSIFQHQISKQDIYQLWRTVYVESPQVQKKLDRDYAELRAVAQHLRSDSETPYEVYLDKKDLTSLRLSKGQYSDEEGRRERTDLAYLFIPEVFLKARDSGRLRVLWF